MKFMLEKFTKIHRLSCVYLDRQLKSVGIRSGQFMYITLICENDGLSQENISSELKVDKSTAARALKQLETDGYISRVVSSEDKRQYCIYATDKAKKIYKKTADIVRLCDHYFMNELTDIEEKLLSSLLDKIVQKID